MMQQFRGKEQEEEEQQQQTEHNIIRLPNYCFNVIDFTPLCIRGRRRGRHKHISLLLFFNRISPH